jgi:maltooligosyltrehalose trehalohydrolase
MLSTIPSPHFVATARQRGPYRVWAPRAEKLQLRLNGQDLPMTRDTEGWWAAERIPAPGERYGYVVNDAGPFPDPRSHFQPDGVHGLSEWIDHAAYRWSDAGWQARPLASGVIYELHIGTFSPSGTFTGAIERLPELVELGITHVQLMPVVEFSGDRGWGYDGVDLFAPHHAYGRPDELKALVDACHASGLAVILDVVYNHLGPEGNYLEKFGPYFTGRYNTPWGNAVNLDDAGSDEVRRFLCDNAVMWLRDYHFDGLRLDAVHALFDATSVHFLEQLNGELQVLEAALGRHLVLIAESDLNDPRVVRTPEAGGYGLHAQWSDDFHHALHAVVTGERSGYYADFGGLPDLADALHHPFVYARKFSPHRGRTHGREPRGIPGWRFVVAAQNHDQVGNRAQGERLSHLVSPDRLKMAAALLLTAPFVPMLFQGEEWGASSPFLFFTSHPEELGALVAEGRRAEFACFGWDPSQIPDPQAVETFRRSRLCWDERRREPHLGILEWHKQLLALRESRPSLRDGAYGAARVAFDEAQDWLVLTRGEIFVACNFADEPRCVPVARGCRLLMASTAPGPIGADTVALPGNAVAILERDATDARA